MAITASGAHLQLGIELFEGDITFDILSDVIKAVLWNNTLTPDYSLTNARYAVAPYNANEVNWNGTGGSPTAGGLTVTSPTFVMSSGNLLYDAADTASGAGYTFSGVRGVSHHDDTIATPYADPMILLLNFGADFGVTNGVFTVQYHASGIWSQDWTA